MKESYLDRLEAMKGNNAGLWLIMQELEEELSVACMWDNVKYGFSTDELLENLVYIVKENDL